MNFSDDFPFPMTVAIGKNVTFRIIVCPAPDSDPVPSRSSPNTGSGWLLKRTRRNIADNKLAECAGYDRDLLAIELQSRDEVDFELEVTGFATAEIDLAYLPASWPADYPELVLVMDVPAAHVLRWSLPDAQAAQLRFYQ